MVTMDMGMDMAKEQNHKLLVLLIGLFLNPISAANELKLTPRIELANVYTDNINLSESDKDSSLVTTLSPAINLSLLSNKAEIDFDYKYSKASYTHDHDLDKNFTEASLNSRFELFPSGLDFVANGRISNISSNNARNSFADNISGSTTESKDYDVGLEYNVNSSSFSLSSNIYYSETINDDDIGNRNGYNAGLYSQNGNNSRHIFWNLISSYSEYENNQREGRYHTVDATLGIITNFKLNPFIRYYDEQINGNLNEQNIQNTSSIGAGIRWQTSKHLYLDVAYNWSEQDDDSSDTAGDAEDVDDYYSGLISWQPSIRTNINARYYNRFNNDAYELSISHRLRRLTTTISYNESVSLLDRFEFTEGNFQDVWCLASNPELLTSCIISPDTSVDLSKYIFADRIFELIPIEANSFVLNKTFSGQFNYRARRTQYQLSLSQTERENLELRDIDIYDSMDFKVTRTITRNSTGIISFALNKNTFSEGNISFPEQTDYYRIYLTSYEHNFSSSLKLSSSLRHVNRSSSSSFAYKENRVSISLEKEF